MSDKTDFEKTLQAAFMLALDATMEKVPYTRAGFDRLLGLSEPYLPEGWRSKWRVSWVEPTREQLERRELPWPDVHAVDDPVESAEANPRSQGVAT